MALNGIDILGLVCSIAGAMIFLMAIKTEFSIIGQLKEIKKPVSWQIATGFTIFFFFGYIVNIVAILGNITEIRDVFSSLIFLFGALFLVLVVSISDRTYRAIFEAARDDLGEDLELS